MQQFQYTPLAPGQSIRLFSLLPFEDLTSQVCGKLETAAGQIQSYKALSYVWGDAKTTETIKVNGLDFQATTNLVAALRNIRDSKTSVTLWIDAICINQKDKGECNAQIPLMCSIYADATQVLIWLGDGDQYENGLTTLERLGNRALTSPDSTLVPDPLPIPGFPRPQIHNMWLSGDQPIWGRQEEVRQSLQMAFLDATTNVLNPLQLLPSTWPSVRAVLEAPWFRRVWTHQEICVAKRPLLLCGKKQVAFNLVVLAVRAIRGWERAPHGHQITTGVRELLADTELIQNVVEKAKHRNATVLKKGVLTNLEVIKSTTTFDVTDPKDRVYGILGLVDLKEHPAPDYAKGLSDVYRDFALSVISNTRKLNILVFAGGDRGQGADVEVRPTWVPNWHGYRFEKRPEPLSLDGYAAAGTSTASIELLANDRIELEGFVVEKVSKLEGYVSDHRNAQYLERAMNWFPLLMSTKPSNAKDNRADGAWSINHNVDFLRTLLTDITWEGERLWKSRKRFDYIASFVFWAEMHDWFRSDIYHRPEDTLFPPSSGGQGAIFSTGGLAVNEDGVPVPSLNWFREGGDQKDYELRPFKKAIERAMRNRLLFNDSAGHFGLAPLGTHEKDVICVLCGCDLPVVLRPVAEGFQYVGPCFLLHLMDGQIYKEFQAGMRKKEQLKIV